MSGTTYTLTCKNNTTDTVWTFVVLISLPNATGSQNLAWKLATVAFTGTGSITWTTDTEVCLATPTGTPPPVIYQAAQTLPSANGASWKVVASSGIAILQASSTAPLMPGTIQITNNTLSAVNVGYGQSGAMAVVQPGLPGNASTVFYPTPSYSLYLSTSVSAGQVIQVQQDTTALLLATVFLLPQPLTFPQNITTATATLSGSGSSVNVTIVYGSS